MANKESTFLNMTLTLFLITAIAGGTLGGVYQLTKDTIALEKQKKLQNAISIVVPGADKGEIVEFNYPSVIEGDRDSVTFYQVVVEEKIIGTAIKSYTNKGFSGYFAIMVGFDENGVIIDNNMLEHKETPGLGDKTDKNISDWNFQFIDKDPKSYNLTVKKDGGDVDAITAATISSRAYCDALDRAYKAFMDYQSKNKGGNK